MNKFLWFLGGAAACYGGLTIYGLYRITTDDRPDDRTDDNKPDDKTTETPKRDFYGGIGATKKQPSNIF